MYVTFSLSNSFANVRPVDPSAIDWKARTGLTSLGKAAESEEQASSESDRVSLANQLCYACLTTLTPTINRKPASADTVELPLWVGQRVQVGRDEMKAGIQDFLLEED